MNQTHTVDQIVVVDNDSKDNTLEILSSVSDPRMKIIKNTRNVGFAAGHNIAIQHSNCDYYLVLNPDVELHPDYVFYLVKFMEERLDVGSCTGKLIRMSDQSILDSTGISIYRSRKAVDRGSKQHIDQWADRCEVFGVSGAAAMYRKEMVEDISIDGEFFDELFFAYKEDVDVAWRARILGWKSYYIPDSTAYHERGWKEKGEASKFNHSQAFIY